ncbi:DNA translocase FtsK [bacterium]|nr:DNA translocase FtsK [bacterium]
MARAQRHWVRGLVALLAATLLLGALAGPPPGDWPGQTWGERLLDTQHPFGIVGALLAGAQRFLLGALGAWLLGPYLLLAGLADFAGRPRRSLLIPWSAVALLALLWLGAPAAGGPSAARQGWLGELLSEGISRLLGPTGTSVCLALLSAIGLVILLPAAWVRGPARLLFGWLPRALLRAARAVGLGLGAGGRGVAVGLRRGGARLAAARARRRAQAAEAAAARAEAAAAVAAETPPRPPLAVAAPPPAAPAAPGGGAAAAAAPALAASAERAPRPKPAPRRPRGAGAPLPALTLLAPAAGQGDPADRRFAEERARLLVDKLASFNIGGRVSAMSQGPVVTTYEFEPDAGVKVSQIVSRREDLALALRSKELRMVAPIPGKAAVGIELPNPRPRVIRLREVLEAAEPQGAGGELALALGVDVDGRAVWTDLAEMPHLLVAGATGTGKSVCINSILLSLLLAHTPETLRLFLVDPKMLELSVYNEIPHLLHPVITDNRVALSALNWLVGEMERRYLLLKPVGVRSIGEYNAKVRAGEVTDAEGRRVEETLPFLVGVVEEFADLMMTLGKDVQPPIVRLAQMARAVGIHLILATQRPSVDIIDGVIKANFPSRIAFKVFSRFDSKTILDAVGAETLIGRGDMLFKHGRQPFPRRLHGAFVETAEVERVVAHWRAVGGEPGHIDLEQRREGGLDFEGEDELFGDAKRTVILAGFGSTTMLQRRLRVGYTRASRLMDMLEDAGIVGPHTGSKARELLVGPEALAPEDREARP